MEAAEVRTKKRIRHCYPNNELYHRFIHSGEYAYSPNIKSKLSCIGNYIAVGTIGKKQTIEDFEEMFNCNRTRIVAIIDREHKRILISYAFREHAFKLRRAVPEYYKIYFTNSIIPHKDILNNKNEYLELHAKYLIERFVNYNLCQCYKILNNKAKCLYQKPSNLFNISSDSLYRDIIAFIVTNNIDRTKIYNKCFDKDYVIHCTTNSIHVKLPTLRELQDKEVFSEEEKTLLAQRYFWTIWCNGEGILFKDVVNNWYKKYTKDEIIKYFDKHFGVNPDWFTLENTFWQNYISKAVECIRNHNRARIKEALNKSNANFIEANSKLSKQINASYTVDDWRNKKCNYINSVTYRKFIPSKNRNSFGEWKDATLTLNSNKILFEFTQLRLNTDKNRVETSRNAAVSIKEAITCFKLFLRTRRNNPGEIHFTFGSEYKVGIYNLREIKYTEKKSDYSHVSRGYYDWVIRIGCHNLWMQEIIDFIIYYHLEEQFGLEMINGNWNVYNNQIK